MEILHAGRWWRWWARAVGWKSPRWEAMPALGWALEKATRCAWDRAASRSFPRPGDRSPRRNLSPGPELPLVVLRHRARGGGGLVANRLAGLAAQRLEVARQQLAGLWEQIQRGLELGIVLDQDLVALERAQ